MTEKQEKIKKDFSEEDLKRSVGCKCNASVMVAVTVKDEWYNEWDAVLHFQCCGKTANMVNRVYAWYRCIPCQISLQLIGNEGMQKQHNCKDGQKRDLKRTTNSVPDDLVVKYGDVNQHLAA